MFLNLNLNFWILLVLYISVFEILISWNVKKSLLAASRQIDYERHMSSQANRTDDLT